MERPMRPNSDVRLGCRTFGWLTPLMIVTMAMALSCAPSRAQPTDAKGVVKSMSDFIAKQKTISITFDSDIEVITPDLQKFQFTNSGTVLMSRPDKLRATRTGGYSHVELVFDGKTAAILNTDANVYTRLDAAGSIDQLIERLRADHAVTAPGADLLLANVYDELMEDVYDAKYIGIGVIDGVECAHLAFRTPEVDWQIWIETGARPIPRKYVITSKTVTAAPQYTLRIKDWKTDAQISADSFTFTPPQGTKQVAAKEFPRADEVPDGVVMGGLK
jgi:hypothetical protein